MIIIFYLCCGFTYLPTGLLLDKKKKERIEKEFHQRRAFFLFFCFCTPELSVYRVGYVLVNGLVRSQVVIVLYRLMYTQCTLYGWLPVFRAEWLDGGCFLKFISN